MSTSPAEIRLDQCVADLPVGQAGLPDEFLDRGRLLQRAENDPSVTAEGRRARQRLDGLPDAAAFTLDHPAAVWQADVLAQVVQHRVDGALGARAPELALRDPHSPPGW